MLRNDKKGLAVVWVAVIAVLVVAAASYFIFTNNSEEAEPVNNQETVNDIDESAEATEPVDEVEEVAGTVITTGDSEFGTMLFDETGQAIYIWEVEETSEPECYGDCADAWPPVLTDGAPVAMDGVDSDLLGTTERTDGTTQVTYNDKPLYYYADEAPGQVLCHNVSTHGGLWWVIQPNGERAP